MNAKEIKERAIYIANIAKVAKALERHNVPYRYEERWNGALLRFDWTNGDVACHEGVPGALYGMVESYQFTWDGDDVTRMNARDMAALIIGEYEIYVVDTFLDTITKLKEERGL